MSDFVEGKAKDSALLEDLLMTNLRIREREICEFRGDREHIRSTVATWLADAAEGVLLRYPDAGPWLERRIAAMAVNLESNLYRIFQKREEEAQEEKQKRDTAIRKFCDEKEKRERSS